MRKIKSLALNLPMTEEWYEVGSIVLGDSRDLKVTEIKDCSMEYEDNIQFIYDIYVEGKLYKSIINSPVSVNYFLDGEETATC